MGSSKVFNNNKASFFSPMVDLVEMQNAMASAVQLINLYFSNKLFSKTQKFSTFKENICFH